MGSVILNGWTPAAVHNDFRTFFPSDCRFRLLKMCKLTILALVLTVFLQSPDQLVSLRIHLHIAPRFLIQFPKQKVNASTKSISNLHFSFSLVVGVLLCNIWFIFLIILQSGDIQPNPGPNTDTESTSASDISGAISLMDHLSIVHLNIQSLYPKLDILEAEMQYYDIVVFSETWLSNGRKTEDIMIPNFDAPYRKDRDGRLGGGVAIYIKSGLSTHALTNLIDGDIEGLCVEINVRNHKFLLCGIYRPPNVASEYWDSIERTFENLNTSPIKDLIIVGDFNCNMKENNIPNRMHNLILSYDLCQLIDQPTHFTEHSSTIIDLAIVNDPENVLFSDVISPFIPNLVRFHCPILIALKFRKPRQKTFNRHIWLYDRGDYNLYRNKLRLANWDDLFESEDVNEISKNITNQIIIAARDTIPNMNVIIRPNEPEWINTNLKKQIRQRKRLFRKAKRTNNVQAWNKFKAKRNEVTRQLRERKRYYFEKLASDLRDNSTNSKSWYKTAAKFLLHDSNQRNVPVLETETGLIEDDLAKVEVLNNFFVKQSTVDDSNAQLPNLVTPEYNPLTDIAISQQDVLNAIKDLDAHKASGPDAVSPKLIKEGKHELAYPYSKLFNLSIRSRRFPDPYKLSNVTPVHKKDSRTNPNNYRPISLNSNQGKIFERTVHKKLNDYLTHNNVLSPYQSGFRQGDSTVNQLLFLYNDFLKALDDNKEIRIVYCDISKAFDRVWHKGLLFKLRTIGLSENIVDWFKDYLSNRKQRVCIKGVASSWKNVTAGVPQGSILGPTLFLIYINDIVNGLGCNIRLFADDTTLYIIVENPVNAAIQLNVDLQIIYNWAGIWLVDFHANKTESQIVSRKRNKPAHPPLFMGNTQIKEVSKHKHLGLIFSSDCNWSQHIEYIIEKAWKRIGSLRRNKFILDRLSLLKLYVTYIRSLLEYANIIWDNCSIENKRHIESIQLEALRIITGATKLCSVQRLYNDITLQTLQSRRNNQRLCQLYKILNDRTPQYLQSLIPQRIDNIPRYQLRNVHNVIVPNARTTSYANSFLPSTIRDWNLLDLSVRNSPSLNAFKRQINRNNRELIIYPKFFDAIQTTRLGQIYHTRLRLECSSLKQHLFNKNIVGDPLCSCGAIETTSHYLLSCTNYQNLRTQYLNCIPPPLSVAKLMFGMQDAPDEQNNFIFRQVQLYILATKRFDTVVAP